MSYSFDGATASLDNSGSAPLTATPCTLVVWLKTSAVGSTQTLLALNTTGGGSHQFELVLDSSGVIQAQTSSTSTSSGATVGTVTNGVWSMAGGVYASATSRQGYLNGELAAANTVSRVPVGINEIRMGKSRSGAGAFNQFANSLLAYAWIWNIALSEANLDALYNGGAGGVDPSTIQGANLIWRSDLLLSANPQVDTIGGINLTVTAATFSSDNPFTISAGGGGIPRFMNVFARRRHAA